ncbi:MAG: glycosyltransferase [Alphaproteobacteria bacterium]|nr:glycosyltransferase [Alphaproteobacteria bacterium]
MEQPDRAAPGEAGDARSAAAIWAHRRQWPELSAYRLTARLARPALVLLVLGLLLAPGAMLAAGLAACMGFHLVDLAFTLRIAMAGRGGVPLRPGPCLPDEALPVYTLLLPVHDEAAQIDPLLRSIDALAYPRARLDARLLVEADDAATLAAARTAVASRPHVTLVRVPPSLPRTKPKAMNYALADVRGAFLTIYDAEDRPHPDQLRRAVEAFAEGGPALACLQAQLGYHNAGRNWLTGQFELEYRQWFQLFLPGLARLGLPIPLGGTSNHFRVDVLRRLGGWDPFNVTEDAELGLRLAEAGYRVGCLSSLTEEEACSRLGPWLRQRTRWTKGYLQTFLLRCLDPRRHVRRMGLRAYAAAQLFLGGRIVAALINPLLWLGLLSGMQAATPGSPLTLAGGMGLSTLAMMGLAAIVPLRQRARGLLWFVPTLPLYWVLGAVAGYRALLQLFMAPHLWEKTPHGLDGLARPARRPPARAALPALGLGLLAVLVTPGPAVGGAWTRERGDALLISELRRLGAGERFDAAGQPEALAAYEKREFDVYAEYGLRDWLTGVGTLLVQTVEAEGPSPSGERVELGLGARVRLFEAAGVALAAEGRILVPSRGLGGASEALESGEPEVELRGLLGTSYEAFGRPGYSEVQGAWRPRTGAFGDLVEATVSLGYSLTDPIEVTIGARRLAELSGTEDPAIASFLEVNAGVRLVLGPRWSMRLTARKTLEGRNAVREAGGGIALWRRL